ncbi:MAG: serine/threonine protein kinase [Myxococcota bacterium]|nr:serine/threonine protein kinase [Myxococcota bacterium]
MAAPESKGTQDWAGNLVAGKYELRRRIGAGAMGAVYECAHVELGKRLAIKLLHPEFCGSPEAVARFRREARAASAIESEHVAQIFDFGRDTARGLYMVIEYLEGEDLEVRLARERPIDVVEAVTMGWQVARGLARAHAAGVIHRDLKPANLFLTRREDGSLLAKILDFGISKREPRARTETGDGSVEWAAEPTLTEHGTTLGTPQYMSPEQCEGKGDVDARTDIWSLCAVIHEALAGEPAISDQGGHVGAMQRIVSMDVCPLAQRAPWVPEAVARIVDAGLVRDRDVRIRDASILANSLRAACPGIRTRAPGGAREQPIIETKPAPGAPETGTSSEEDGGSPSSAEDRVEIFRRTRERPIPAPTKPGGHRT